LDEYLKIVYWRIQDITALWKVNRPKQEYLLALYYIHLNKQRWMYYFLNEKISTRLPKKGVLF